MTNNDNWKDKYPDVFMKPDPGLPEAYDSSYKGLVKGFGLMLLLVALVILGCWAISVLI